MSHHLICHSDDLSRLVAEGYAIQIKDGYLLVKGIPYLDQNGCICYGVFACPISATAESTQPPTNHIMVFSGGMPHDQHGQPLNMVLGRHDPMWSEIDELRFQHGFSIKPCESDGRFRNYKDFHEKVKKYTSILIGPVQAIDPSVTVKADVHMPSKLDETPFVFHDSASARAGTARLTAKFKGEVIALIGLGGTGAYILDHVSKTPVKQIRLIDGKKFEPHNAFRSPGAPSQCELQAQISKVEYHAARFGQMHKNIVPHPVKLCEKNFNLLVDVTFAFVSIDPCPEKALILSELEHRKIPFVYVGMGLKMSSNGITGTVRAILSTEDNRDLVREHIPVEPGEPDDMYDTNVQISDLNSLNANMAIQLWKSHLGFYAYFCEPKPIWTYQVGTRKFIQKTE